MPGHIDPAPGESTGYITACSGDCTRALRWHVDTYEHAVNLLAKHLREYHPDEVPADPDAGPALRVSAAAAMVLALVRDPHLGNTPAAHGALDVWEVLTGLPQMEALDYAEKIAPGDLAAHVPPF